MFITFNPTAIKSKARLEQEAEEKQQETWDEEQLKLHQMTEEWMGHYVTKVNPPMKKGPRRPKTKIKPR